MTSSDGITWTVRSVLVTMTIGKMSHTAMDFVAVSWINDKIMTSPDGIIGPHEPTLEMIGGGVTYGNGRFVAVGDFSTQVLTSTDGIAWTGFHLGGSIDDWQSVTFADGLFVAVADEGDNRVMIVMV